jgi:hypothetical protein
MEKVARNLLLALGAEMTCSGQASISMPSGISVQHRAGY